VLHAGVFIANVIRDLRGRTTSDCNCTSMPHFRVPQFHSSDDIQRPRLNMTSNRHWSIWPPCVNSFCPKFQNGDSD